MTVAAVAISLIVAAFGLMIVLGGRQREAELEALPKRTCGEAATSDGPARVEGFARASAPLTGPVSRSPCVYYELVARKKTHRALDPDAAVYDNDGFSWRTEIEERRWASIELEDETGRVRVLGDGADVNGAHGHSIVLHGELLDVIDSERQRDLRAALGLPEGHFEVHEASVPVGTRLCASGELCDGELNCDRGRVEVGSEREARARDRGANWLGWVLLLGGILAAAGMGMAGAGLLG